MGAASQAPVKVAILGAGYIADYHLDALRQLPQVAVSAVCDLSRERAERLATARGIPGAYTDLAEMLAKERLDVVHVLTPPNLHADPAAQVLAAGVDVYLEKPMCSTGAECDSLRALAAREGRALGVSHNFLFFPAYERLAADVAAGRLGPLDQVDVVWNKELGQLRGGPFGAWMLAHPKNVLFEVGPHSFAHVVHLVGALDDLSVETRDPVDLPRGLRFQRRWEIRGWRGETSVRVRFSFLPGYPEHYVHVRGSNGTATVDFEKNTYVVQTHTPHLLDVDRFANVLRSAGSAAAQATTTLGRFIFGKMGLAKSSSPFPHSVARAVACFYDTRLRGVDDRLGPELAGAAVALAERAADAASLSPPEGVPAPVDAAKQGDPTVLVIGGTGFIGGALVRRLRQEGRAVRVMARDPQGCPPELRSLGVEVVRGDFTDAASVAAALPGIRHVYHLARGFGKTWSEYERFDVEPTRRVAELCLEHGVERLFYASSIAIYYAGARAGAIVETTLPHEGTLRASPYARSKAENERALLALHRTRGLPVVIFRPGIVLGRGGSPYHFGIAEWPYDSVCRLWGDGDSLLPIVLVDDAADAMVRALDAEGIDGESFNLCGPPSITANQYLDEFEKQAGLTLRRIQTPAARHFLEAAVKWGVKTIRRDPEARMPSYADWEGRSFRARFDSGKAERELGWVPEQDRGRIVREGIHVPVEEFLG